MPYAMPCSIPGLNLLVLDPVLVPYGCGVMDGTCILKRCKYQAKREHRVFEFKGIHAFSTKSFA
jgi:hypothetical protein